MTGPSRISLIMCLLLSISGCASSASHENWDNINYAGVACKNGNCPHAADDENITTRSKSR